MGAIRVSRTIKDLEEWASPYDDLTLCDLYSKRLAVLDGIVKAGGWDNVSEDVEDDHICLYMTIVKKQHTQRHAEALTLDRLRDVGLLEDVKGAKHDA